MGEIIHRFDGGHIYINWLGGVNSVYLKFKTYIKIDSHNKGRFGCRMFYIVMWDVMGFFWGLYLISTNYQ